MLLSFLPFVHPSDPEQKGGGREVKGDQLMGNSLLSLKMIIRMSPDWIGAEHSSLISDHISVGVFFCCVNPHAAVCNNVVSRA